MSKTLYLMRHGETLFNVQKRIQGWCDSPLTEAGEEQARQARTFFEGEGIQFDRLYASTSERASDTLELATGRTDYQRLKGLKEWNFGRMEGQQEYLHPNRRPDQTSHEDFYVLYDGDGVNDVQQRMAETVGGIFEELEEGQVALAVSHAGAIMQYFLSLKLDQHPELHFSNCCIFHYQLTDGFMTLVRIINPVSGQIYQ